MQQTQKYKLNLIERDDPFLPEALNANTQKVEDLISAHQEEVKTATDGLDARVKVFEAKKFAYGTFMLDTQDNAQPFINLGFTPTMVFAQRSASSGGGVLALPGDPPSVSNYVKIVNGGFVASTKLSSAYSGSYTYVAFAL